MTPITLKQIYRLTIDNQSERPLRERYTSYIQELYRLYGKELSVNTFHEGGKLTYSHMGDALFSQIQKDHDLAQFDLILMSYWVHDCDPDFASYAAYFSHQYQLSCPIFDVGDRGSLASFSGLNILKAMAQEKKMKKVLWLGFEQTTVPRCVLDENPIPSENRACAFVFDAARLAEEESALLESTILTEQEILQDPCVLIHFIQNTLEKYQWENKKTKIYLSKTSLLWKTIQFYKLTQQLKEFPECDFYTPHVGSLFFVDAVQKHLEEKQHAIVFHEDYESASYGALVFSGRNPLVEQAGGRA
jgi:hypothetical protein